MLFCAQSLAIRDAPVEALTREHAQLTFYDVEPRTVFDSVVLLKPLGKAVQFFVVHDHAFAFQHHADPTIAKSTAFARDSFHLCADFRVVRWAITPNSFGINTDQPTGPALRDIMIPHRSKRCLSPLVRYRRLFSSSTSRCSITQTASTPTTACCRRLTMTLNEGK